MECTVNHQTCAQCGTCCQKNSPGLHLEDLPLVEKGMIPLAHLYTIRAGELARDNVRGGLLPVPADVIKIKGKVGSWACIYLDDGQNSCGIYQHRPAECRVLECWDTRAIEMLYAENRLDRKTVLQQQPDIWELVRDHQERCDYERLKELIRRLETSHHEEVLKDLSEIIHYDRNIRLLLAEKAKIDPEVCDFLFGRPLTITLTGYGTRIKETDQGKLIITPQHDKSTTP